MKQEILIDDIISQIEISLNHSYRKKEKLLIQIEKNEEVILSLKKGSRIQLETNEKQISLDKDMYIESIVEPYTNDPFRSVQRKKKWTIAIKGKNGIIIQDILSEDVSDLWGDMEIQKFIEKVKCRIKNFLLSLMENLSYKKVKEISIKPENTSTLDSTPKQKDISELKAIIESVENIPKPENKIIDPILINKPKSETKSKDKTLLDVSLKTQMNNRLILVLRLRENNLAVRECIEKRNLKEINPKEFSRAILAYWNGEQSKIPANLVNAFQMQTERETLDLYYYLVSIETKDQNVIALITSNNPREREKGIEMLIKENLRYEFSNLLKELPDNCRMV